MLSSEIADALQILDYRSASVSAVMNRTGAENRFTDAMRALETLAIQENIPIALVGGLAAIRYGYPAVTEVIDVVIGKENLEKLVEVASKYGFRTVWKAASGWHTLEHGDVEINVVPEGGRARNDAPTTIPSPVAMGVAAGIDYADLPHWIELKISSNRRKDQTHIVEVLKAHASDVVETIQKHLAKIHPDYLARFNELAAEADQERQQENERR